MTDLAARLLAVPEAEAKIPETHRRAAVAIALRGREVLLMKRAEREDDRWSGQISLPGGHEEEDDGDLAVTATRETREELGVDLTRARLLGALAPVRARARGVPLETTILPAVFTVEGELEFALGPEAQAAFWFPLDRAAAGELDSIHRYLHDDIVVQLPSWEFEGHVVWGLTHGILSGLLALDPG